MAEALSARVGSRLSYNSLVRDLEVDPKTVKRWVDILDTLYFCFRIAPYGAPKIRAVKKEQKLYLWDWSQVENKGERFENMMACQLLKFCHFHEDTCGEKMELRYLRDTDGREVDFLILKKKKPLFAVECKLRSKSFSKDIYYFKERVSIPTLYQVNISGEDRQVGEGLVMTSFLNFCKYENMI